MSDCKLTIKNELLKNFLGQDTFDSYDQLEEALAATVREKQIIPISQGSKKGFHKIELDQTGKFYLVDLGDPDGPAQISLGNLDSDILLLFNFEPSVLDSYVKSAIDEYYSSRPTKENRPKTPADTANNIDHLRSILRYISSVLPNSKYIKQLNEIINEYDNYQPEPFGIPEEPYYFYPYQYSTFEDGVFQETDDIEKARLDFGRALSTGSFRLNGSTQNIEIYVRIEPDTLQNAQSAQLEESQLNAVLVPYVRINDQWQRVFISKNQPDEYSLSITIDPENARTVGVNGSPRFTFHIPNLTNSMYKRYQQGKGLDKLQEVANILDAIKTGVLRTNTPSQYFQITPVKIHKHNEPNKVRKYSRVSEFEKDLENVQIGIQQFEGDAPVGFPILMVGKERVPAYPASINPKYRDQILKLVRLGVEDNLYSTEDLEKVKDYLNKVYSYKNSDFRFEINNGKLVILSSIKIEKDKFIPLKNRQSIDFSQFEEVIKKGRVAISKDVIEGTFKILVPNDAKSPFPFTEQQIDGATWVKEHMQTSAAKSKVNGKLVYEPFYTFTFSFDNPYKKTPDPNLPPAPGDFKPVYEDSSLEDFLAKQWSSLEVNEDTQRLAELIIGMASDKLEGYQIKFQKIGKGTVNTIEKIITIDPDSDVPVVLIEEISHALTSDWLQANEDTPEFKRLLEIANKIGFKYDGAKTDMDRVIEFLAKLGDPEVAEKLKNLKGRRQNKNLLDEFTDIIKDIFNRMFKGFSKSIYQETAELYVKIATSPVTTLPEVGDIKTIKAGGREIKVKPRRGIRGLTPPKSSFGADYDSVLNNFKSNVTSEYGKVFLDNALQSFTGDLVELLGKVQVQGVVENLIPSLLNGKLDFEMVYNSLLDIYQEQLEVLSDSDPTNPRVAYLGFILDGDNPDIFKEIFKEENKVFSIKRDKTLAERLEIGSDEEVRDEENTSEEVKTAADETDVERMGAAPKDEYKREPNKFNFDEADRKVKALIQLLPQIERNEDGTTKFYLKEQVDEQERAGVSPGRFFVADMLGDEQRYVKAAETSLGSLKLNDTIVTWSNLTRIFANAFSIEDMVENANHFRDKVNQEVPEFYALKSFLDTDNIKDFEHNQLLVKFEAAFKRFENPLYIVLVDKGKRNVINESADIFLTVKKVVNSNLRVKVLEENSKYEKAYDEESDTLNLTEIIPEFTNLEKLPNETAHKLKFLSALGMEFSQAMVANNQIAFDNFAHTVFNFLKATGWESVPVEISDYITKDQKSKEGKVQKGLNNLFKITFTLQHEYTPFSYTIMNPNAEGEAQSTFSIPNSILQDAAILNSTFYKKQPLTVNLLETLIPRSTNPSSRSTLTFKKMFNPDGTRNLKNKIQVVNWNGEKITQEGTASEGRLNVNLDDSAKVYFDFIGLMTKGLHENTRAQVSTTSYAFRLEDYGNSQEYPIAFGTIKAILKEGKVSLSRESVLDLFVGYHNAEIEERKLLAKNPGELAPPMFSKMFSEGELFQDPEYQSLINQKIETNEDKEKFGKLLYEYIDTITKEYAQEFSKAGGFDGLRDEEGKLHSKIQDLLDDNKAEDADLNKRAILATYAVNSTVLHIEEVLLFQGSFQRVSLPKIKYFKRSNTVQSTRIPITGSQKLREYINEQLKAASFASTLNFDPFQLGDKAKTSVLADIEESVSDEVRDQMIDGYVKSATEYYQRAGIQFVRGGKEDTAQVIQEMAEKVAGSYTEDENGKGKVNISDGQGHINPDAYVGFLLGVGGDPNLLIAHKALALDLIYNQDVYFNEEEIKRFGIRAKDSLTEQELQEMREGMELLDKGKVVFPSLKWTHRGSVKAEDGVAKEVLDKFSLFPLYIQYVYDKPHLKNLVLSMMETGMAYTKFISGSKMDNFGVVDYEALMREGGNLATALQESSYEILTNNFGEQIKTPTYAKVSNTYGSQFRKLILQGLISVKEESLVDSWGMSNREFSRSIEDKVLKEFGIQDKDFTNLDLKKIAKVLKEQATSRELDDNVLNFLKAMEDGTYDKMESTFNQKEVQNLIANIVKRIAIQKLQGAQLIQVSSALDHYGEDRLKWYSLGNPAECKVSMQGDFMNLLNLPEVKREVEKLPKEDRTVLAKTRILNRLLKNKDFVEKHKDSLTVVTYRIPTQGHNSMDVFRIKEFLPHFQAPQIVLPPEAVVKSGTDYDYDKASAIFPSIDSRGNYQRIENIEGFDKTLDQIKEEYKATKEQLWEDFKEEVKTKKSEFYDQLNFDFLKSEQRLLNEDFLENQARIEQLQEERKIEPDKSLRKAIDIQLKVLFETQEEILLEQANLSQEISTLREDFRLSNNIEYQTLLNKLQTEKTNLYNQYVDDINFLKSYSAQSIYQNKLLEDSIGILLHPLNFFKLITPNSNELIFTGYLDEFLENLYGKGFRSEPSGSDIVRHKYNFLKFKVVKGKDLLGIVAASNTFFTLLQTYGTQINSSYNRKVNNKFSLKQTVRTPLISPEHRLVISTKDGISLKHDLTEDNQFKSEVISQLINVTVDMPGNDKFGFTNFNYDNFGAALYLIQIQGVTFSTLLHFFHQPVVFKYEDQIRKMSKGGKKPSKYEQAVLLAQIFGVPTMEGNKNKNSKQLHTELYRELNKWEKEFNKEDLAGNIKPLEEIFNGQYDLYNLSDFDKAVLAYYIKVTDQASIMREVDASINFDRNPDNLMMKYIDRVNTLAEVQKAGLIDSKFIPTIFNKSAISGLYTNPILGAITNKLFPALFHKTNAGVFNILAKAASNKEILFNKVTNDFMSSIVQNFATMDFEGRENVPVKEIGDRYLKGEGKNKLISKAKKLNKEFKSQGKDIRLLRILTTSVSSRRKDVSNVQIFLGFEKATVDVNRLIREFQELLEHPQEDVRNFARALAATGITQAGYQKSPLFFSNLIPPEFIAPIIQHAVHKYMLVEKKGEYAKAFMEKFQYFEKRLFDSKGNLQEDQREVYRYKDYTIPVQELGKLDAAEEPNGNELAELINKFIKSNNLEKAKPAYEDEEVIEYVEVTEIEGVENDIEPLALPARVEPTQPSLDKARAEAKKEAFKEVEQRMKDPQTNEDWIADYLKTKKISTKSFKSNVDPNWLQSKLNFISNKGEPIDTAAEGISDLANREITTDEVIEFISSYSSVTNYWNTVKDILEANLFAEISEYAQQSFGTYKGKIESLKPNQVFVFGSNPLGINGNPSKGTGGAALVAYNIAGVKQGEKMDNKLSDSGKAWGITTVTAPGAKRSKTPDEIKEGIKKLYNFASQNTNKEFLIAYQGTEGRNLNGYSNQELAEMFAAFDIPSNIVFEEEFNKLVRKNPNQTQTNEKNECPIPF